jgi:hypothetical protein
VKEQPEGDGARAAGQRGVATKQAGRDALEDSAGGRHRNDVHVEHDSEHAIEQRDRRSGKEHALQIRAAWPLERCRDRRHKRLVEERGRLRIPRRSTDASITS